jgi:hypothetical protein
MAEAGAGVALGPSTAGFLEAEYFYFLEFAASVIQRHWRGYLVRKDFYRQVNKTKMTVGKLRHLREAVA